MTNTAKIQLDTSQLISIAQVHDFEGGPRSAYQFFFRRAPESTAAVEDFIIDFYTQYNAEFDGGY